MIHISRDFEPDFIHITIYYPEYPGKVAFCRLPASEYDKDENLIFKALTYLTHMMSLAHGQTNNKKLQGLSGA